MLRTVELAVVSRRHGKPAVFRQVTQRFLLCVSGKFFFHSDFDRGDEELNQPRY